jgi:hypothetical protein
MKKIALAAAIAIAALAPVAVIAQTSAPASVAKAYYTVDESTLGELMDNPATKAILVKYLPQMMANEGISQAAGLTLRGLQQYASEVLTDDVLKKIDAELRTVPAPKP